jgi:hypothetical protein
VNQDDPAHAAVAVLPPGAALYGGSEDSTSDALSLQAVITPAGSIVAAYTWTVTGPRANFYTPPPSSPAANLWKVGRIKPSPGKLTFKVVADLVGGSKLEATRAIEVGIRTDDTIMVGWIDTDRVKLPAGASSAVTALLPVNPAPPSSPQECSSFLLDLSNNNTRPHDISLTPADRNYVLYWMLRFAANRNPKTAIPGGDFSDPTLSFTDENKVANFVNQTSSYKLFSRFQVKFRLAADDTFAVPPTVLHQQTAIGSGSSFCGVGPMAPGQAGPANAGSPVLNPNNKIISLIADGSPDAATIRAFNTLTAKDVAPGTTPVFWEDFGAKITFTWGSPTAQAFAVQPYPTYYEYRNGKLVHEKLQALSPLEQFQPNPYPFGTVPCSGAGGVTPGGRCGNATLPAEPSARVPTYTQP